MPPSNVIIALSLLQFSSGDSSLRRKTTEQLVTISMWHNCRASGAPNFFFYSFHLVWLLYWISKYRNLLWHSYPRVKEPARKKCSQREKAERSQIHRYARYFPSRVCVSHNNTGVHIVDHNFFFFFFFWERERESICYACIHKEIERKTDTYTYRYA